MRLRVLFFGESAVRSADRCRVSLQPCERIGLMRLMGLMWLVSHWSHRSHKSHQFAGCSRAICPHPVVLPICRSPNILGCLGAALGVCSISPPLWIQNGYPPDGSILWTIWTKTPGRSTPPSAAPTIATSVRGSSVTKLFLTNAKDLRFFAAKLANFAAVAQETA